MKLKHLTEAKYLDTRKAAYFVQLHDPDSGDVEMYCGPFHTYEEATKFEKNLTAYVNHRADESGISREVVNEYLPSFHTQRIMTPDVFKERLDEYLNQDILRPELYPQR